jgi:hypothetical protein
MRVIKLKTLLREIQLKEGPVAADLPPVKFVMPAADHAYGKAASDAAGKPYTQPNIDFRDMGKSDSESQLVSKAANVIKAFENSKNNPKGGYNKQLKKWFPHKSLEGGAATIAYGHKMQPGEDYSRGLTDNEAESLLEKDIRSKIKLAQSKMKNFDGMPLTIKIAVINALFRGDMGPRTMDLLSQNKFGQAAKEYLNHREYRTTSNSGVKKRMDWNYKVMNSAG